MADETELTITRKRRGRYREYMRHSNPYKFPAARRRKGNFQKAKQSPAVTRNGFNKCESDVQEVFCEQPRELRCTVDTVELLQVEKTYTSPGEVCSYEQIQDMDDSRDSELEDKDDLLSEDELFFRLTHMNDLSKMMMFARTFSVTLRTLNQTMNPFQNNVKQKRMTFFIRVLQSKAARVLCCCYRLCLNTSLHVKHSAIYLQ